jgi:hypothetical protein
MAAAAYTAVQTGRVIVATMAKKKANICAASRGTSSAVSAGAAREAHKDLCTVRIPASHLPCYCLTRQFPGGIMDLFLREAAVRIDADDVLSKIDALIEWRAFSPILQRGLGRSGRWAAGL